MKNKNILIVEDMAMDRQMLALMVKKLGFHCVLCVNGDEAINLLKASHATIDLVLLDLNMPSVDGISTLGHCKGNYPGLPVIIVSGSEDIDDITQTKKWGADGFVPKPFDADVLKAAIEDALYSSPSSGGAAYVTKN